MQDRSSTHASFLLRLKDGDDAVWREFFDRYGDLVRNFARRRGLQAADADDIVQEVSLAVRRVMPTFEYSRERGRFRGLLKTIALRAIWAQLRARRADVVKGEDALAEAEADPAIDGEWESEWRQYHMRTALERMRAEFPPADVQAFRAYGVEGKSVADTAAALAMSADQVYQAKSRVLKRLRALIAEQIADEG